MLQVPSNPLDGSLLILLLASCGHCSKGQPPPCSRLSRLSAGSKGQASGGRRDGNVQATWKSGNILCNFVKNTESLQFMNVSEFVIRIQDD